MLVRMRMTANPVTVTPQDTLATAHQRMQTGRFRRLPVIHKGMLVGIVTDRDLQRYVGSGERTHVGAAMTAQPVTVTPTTTVEDASQVMLARKIGGLPVVEDGKLVGTITTSDILQAFLEGIGATTPASVCIDIVHKDDGKDLADTCRIVHDAGGTVLGMGTYVDPWSRQPFFFLRMSGVDGNVIAA